MAVAPIGVRIAAGAHVGWALVGIGGRGQRAMRLGAAPIGMGRTNGRWAVAPTGVGQAAGAHVACAPVGVVGGTSSYYGCGRCVRAMLGDGQRVEPPHSLGERTFGVVGARVVCVQRKATDDAAVALVGMGRGALGVAE